MSEELYVEITHGPNADAIELRLQTPITVAIDSAPPSEVIDADDWYARMAARPDFLSGQPLGSQAEIDSLKPPQKPTNYPAKEGVYAESPGYDPAAQTQKKRPITYDAAEHAALIEIQPEVTTDTQQLYFRFYPNTDGKWPGSFLTICDLKLDENFCWRREVVEQYGSEQFNRHKARQIRGGNNGAYITERTFYDAGYWETQAGDFATQYVAEYCQTSNSSTRMLPPLSWTENEKLSPRLATFYMLPNVWSRRWTLVEYAGPLAEWTETPVTADQLKKWPNGSVIRVSTWYADETREPVQTLDAIPMICEYAELNCLADEWDTGQDSCPPVYDESGELVKPGDTRLRHGHSRNMLAFLNPQSMSDFLEKPWSTPDTQAAGFRMSRTRPTLDHYTR